MDLPPMVFEQMDLPSVPGKRMDQLWSEGWRHFGSDFFRYSISFDENGLRIIQPLRLDIAAFTPSKSQRRVWRKNADTRLESRPAGLDPEVCAMFQRHKQRFATNVPDDLTVFLGRKPGQVVPCQEFRVSAAGMLLAVSFLDVGEESVSSVYGIFEPTHSHRSLGIFTMLAEIRWAQENGFRHYYPGYATREPSHYDYKKLFAPMSYLDWKRNVWLPLPRLNQKAADP